MKAFKRTVLCLIFLFILCLPSYMAFSKSGEIQTEKGKLEIWFRITSTPMTEREIYYHVCRLYIDEAAAGESPFVNKESKWFRLFSVELEEGVYDARVVNETAEVDPEKCLGCGLCNMVCPTESLSMKRRDEIAEPKRDFRDLMSTIMQEKGKL